MTRKNGLEKVNRISLKNKVEWYSKQELELLASLNIECSEVILTDEEKKEHEKSLSTEHLKGDSQ